MARNKYPEETINRILDVSMNLFLEKGYEHTSIQNIIDNLGGLTKGAIYHHFKSKEDILLAVTERLYQDHDKEWMESLAENKTLTGLEKLRMMLRGSLASPKQDKLFAAAPNMLKNPKMLTIQIQSIFEETAPLYLRPIIEQGIADGSIQTDYPEELAEVILLLLNLWLNPMVYYDEPKVIQRRIGLFQQMLLGMGVDLIDEAMKERFEELCTFYGKNK